MRATWVFLAIMASCAPPTLEVQPPSSPPTPPCWTFSEENYQAGPLTLCIKDAGVDGDLDLEKHDQ